ncbi:hypothetical protein [Pseudomarimonas arenosa]|uniref:Uncharacterized protein n=1 Tax=Pseudomarimonas arenosa TaxID=2774145 RepID=A0AAW3ZR51_9GAMM|nr:hypothetical protein [Pseudomarimonas arenosa]MBD8528188.1 hypothetical protein [Pseudomarimonas arenosa]
MASPLWEQIIAAIIERSFDLRITGGGNDIAWGFALVVCGLLYHLAMHGMTQRHEAQSLARQAMANTPQLDHDRALFRRLQDTVSEGALLDLLDHLACNHGARYDRLSKLGDLIHFMEQPDHQFIVPAVRDPAKQLLQALAELDRYVCRNFFPLRHRTPEDGLFLHPELNIDRGGSGIPEEMARYTRFATEFDDLIETARQQYLAFRVAIKHSLAA